jgi:hypothetical protein
MMNPEKSSPSQDESLKRGRSSYKRVRFKQDEAHVYISGKEGVSCLGADFCFIF